MTSDIILTDIDGVCLDWRKAFTNWMHTKGMNVQDNTEHNYSVAEIFGIDCELANQLVREFNDSAAIGYLDAYLDSRYWIRMLNERHSIKFLAVTSLSRNYYAGKARKDNLNRLFGDAFIDVICLDTAAPKYDCLKQLDEAYGGAWWIEDKIENADDGLKLGYRSILMQQDWNSSYTGDAIKASNWEDVYQAIMFDFSKSTDSAKAELSM